jgi:hypothetical protein
MQVKTPQGKIVFEYKTKIPANLQPPSAAYFEPLNTPSAERVSNAAPGLLSKDINYGRNARTLDDFDAVFFHGRWILGKPLTSKRRSTFVCARRR